MVKKKLEDRILNVMDILFSFLPLNDKESWMKNVSLRDGNIYTQFPVWSSLIVGWSFMSKNSRKELG